MAATNSTEVTSPKVKAIDKWGALGGLGLGFIAFILSSLTPDLLPFLGPWAGVVTAALVFLGAGIARIAAYQAPDPLRQNYTAQQNAFEMQRESEQAPAPLAPPEQWATEQWPDNRG